MCSLAKVFTDRKCAAEIQAAKSGTLDVHAFEHTAVTIDSIPARSGKWRDLDEVRPQHGLNPWQAKLTALPWLAWLVTVLILWLAPFCCMHQHSKGLTPFVYSLNCSPLVDTS